MIVPKEGTLAIQKCDILEGLWTGSSEFYVPIKNWGTRPVMLEEGEIVAHIEETSLINGELLSQLHIGSVGTLQEQEALRGLLCSMNDAFALTEHELGETSLVEHRINLEKGKPPFRVPSQQLPYALRTELEGELLKLMEYGCIEPPTSPYASGLVLIRKKDSGLRVCVDYRGISRDTTPDCYPMPCIDDLIDMVGYCKGKVFTTLDLMKDYHQIRMEEESKSKTAFICHAALFQYRRMPFRLTNAPATFQCLMNQLFSGEEWKFVFMYLDDLLIVSQMVQEHLEHVKKVLTKLQQAGLKLKPSKLVLLSNKWNTWDILLPQMEFLQMRTRCRQ